MRILVTGSVAYDLLLHHEGSFSDAVRSADVEHLSMGFITPGYQRHYGGTAANIGWNLRLLNQDPLVVAAVGADGGEYVALLEGRGIDGTHIQRLEDHVTATAIIATDSREQQITFYHPGADPVGHWPDDLSSVRATIGYAIVSPRDPQVMMQAARWCAESAVPFLFDPGQATLGFAGDELVQAMRLSTGVIVNDAEWRLVSERARVSIDDALTMTDFLIITRGEAGVTLYAKDGTTVLHACPAAQVVNPTGAGDALRAGLLTGLSGGWTLKQSLQLGASIASFVVEQQGTQVESLDLNEVLGRAETTYGEALPALP